MNQAFKILEVIGPPRRAQLFIMTIISGPVKPVDCHPDARDRPVSGAHLDVARPSEQKPKRLGPPKLILFAAGALILAGAAYWYIRSTGYQSTDDAAVEAHVIEVSPRISGLVQAVHFDDNYLVKCDDLLLELDPRDFQVAVANADANLAAAKSKLNETDARQKVAEAALGQAEADLTSARATADDAEADFKRNVQLYARHVIDRREYDASAAQAKSAAANVETAAKKVTSQEAHVRLASAQCVTTSAQEKQAEAQRQEAELHLSYTRIFAPFDGRVTKKSVEPGNYVQPGQTLFTLVPPEVWVVANFKETQLTRMKVGQSVSVHVDAIPGWAFKAHIESFQVGTGSRFTLLPPENATGNFVKVVQRVPVKIVFDEPASDLERLWAGESVEPEVDLNSRPADDNLRAAPLPRAILGAAASQVWSPRASFKITQRRL
jgi:membrane fusion protein (multidrug efflux system)